MSSKSNEHITRIAVPRILVMGVGSSGVRAVAKLRKQEPGLAAVMVDTDSKVLAGMDPESILHIGTSVTQGLSAGGDVELGRQSVEKDSSGIRQRLRNVDLLVVVAGLGGGTGSGAVPVITRIAREAGSLVLVMASLPFKFEGKMIGNVAKEALKRIRTHADAIVRIPNERLMDRSDADLPVEEAFSRSHEVMTEGLGAMARLLEGEGVCGLDFACIHTMLRNCDGFCNLAVVSGDGKGRAEEVVDQLLKHPLLGKGTLLKSAVGIIVGLTGGADLKLSEIERVMERLQDHLPEDIWLNFGVIIDPGHKGRLSCVVLLAEEWNEPLVDSAGRQMGLRFNARGAQGELRLEAVGKGEFAHVDPTIYDNQDLDVPTYVRREIKLPR